MFDEKAAWTAVHKGAQQVQGLPTEIQEQVASITVAGSLVRGDFVSGRSDVDIYTALDGDANRPWESEAHSAVRECFDRHFSQYKGSSLNPGVWDDVCISADRLPARPEDFASERFKALGVYFFDFAKYHRTVWGEDFTRSMPAPVDPRPLIPARLARLTEAAERIVALVPQHHPRLSLLAGAGVIALQIFFSDEPSLHKADVLPRYVHLVPEFPEKAFGVDVWQDYLGADFPADGGPLHPPGKYQTFLTAASQAVGGRGF